VREFVQFTYLSKAAGRDAQRRGHLAKLMLRKLREQIASADLQVRWPFQCLGAARRSYSSALDLIRYAQALVSERVTGGDRIYFRDARAAAGLRLRAGWSFGADLLTISEALNQGAIIPSVTA
jgi:hypothetical protein